MWWNGDNVWERGYNVVIYRCANSVGTASGGVDVVGGCLAYLRRSMYSTHSTYATNACQLHMYTIRTMMRRRCRRRRCRRVTLSATLVGLVVGTWFCAERLHTFQTHSRSIRITINRIAVRRTETLPDSRNSEDPPSSHSPPPLKALRISTVQAGGFRI